MYSIIFIYMSISDRCRAYHLLLNCAIVDCSTIGLGSLNTAVLHRSKEERGESDEEHLLVRISLSWLAGQSLSEPLSLTRTSIIIPRGYSSLVMVIPLGGSTTHAAVETTILLRLLLICQWSLTSYRYLLIPCSIPRIYYYIIYLIKDIAASSVVFMSSIYSSVVDAVFNK